MFYSYFYLVITFILFGSVPTKLFIIPFVEDIRNEFETLTDNQFSFFDTCQLTEQKILGRLLKSYNRHQSPRRTAVNVSVELHIQDISALDEFTSEFDIDLMFSEMWIDERLVFASEHNCKQSIAIDYNVFKKYLWTPNICISNTRNARIQSSPSDNVFAIIYNNGRVWSNYRMRVRGPCDLNFIEFPLDKQMCSLTVESYRFNADEVKLKWFEENPVTLMKNFTLADFQFRNWTVDERAHRYPSAEWSQLIVTFHFKRRFGFYFMQTYATSYLIVVTSWIGFFINYRLTPARTTIGVSSLLAVTFQFGNVMMSLPKIGYVKALDVFMLGVTMFIFASLIELAIVCCLANVSPNGMGDLDGGIVRQEGRKSKIIIVNTFVDCATKSSFPLLYLAHQEKMKTFKKEFMFDNVERQESITGQECAIKKSIKKHIKPEDVDKVAIFLFPTAFVLFNAVYWMYYFNHVIEQ